MRNKILLEVCLPAADRFFEVKVPRRLKVVQVTDMLVEFLRKQGGEYIPTKESVLCDMESGNVFDSNAFIDTLGIHNGSRVMLV